MVNFLTLDGRGILSAIVVGLLLLWLGKGDGVYFLFIMIMFLVLSAFVTAIGTRRKKAIGVYEKSRSWKNVVANGFIPVVVVLLYYLGLLHGTLTIVIYTASIASITADKFSSELGVLDGKPRMLLTMKEVKRGTSGGITAFGLVMGIVGAMIIGIIVYPLYSSGFAFYFVVIVVAAIIGDLVDTIFGYFEDKGYGNKYTTNMLCALFGVLSCMAML